MLRTVHHDGVLTVYAYTTHLENWSCASAVRGCRPTAKTAPVQQSVSLTYLHCLQAIFLRPVATARCLPQRRATKPRNCKSNPTNSVVRNVVNEFLRRSKTLCMYILELVLSKPLFAPVLKCHGGIHRVFLTPSLQMLKGNVSLEKEMFRPTPVLTLPCGARTLTNSSIGREISSARTRLRLPSSSSSPVRLLCASAWLAAGS